MLSFLKRLFGKKDNTSEKQSNNTEQTQSENGEIPFDFDLMMKQELVYLEAAYLHQELKHRRGTDDNRLRLSELLPGEYTQHKEKIKSLAVYILKGDVQENELPVQIITSPEDILNFDLFSCLLTEKDEDGHWYWSRNHDATLILQASETVIINLKGIGGGREVKYARATILVEDRREKDDCRSTKTHNSPVVLSTILSSAETDDNDDLRFCAQIAKQLEIKLRNKQERDKLEEEYFYGQFEFKFYYYLGYGKWLYEGQRYFDAYSQLERAFNFIKPQVYDGKEELRDPFYEICNIIGDCLSKMGREDEAWYYYNQGRAAQSVFKPNQLAISYARLGNPVAIGEMKQSMAKLSAMEPEQDKWPKAFKEYTMDLPLQLCKYKKTFQESLEISPLYDSDVTIADVLKLFFGLEKKNLLPRMKVYDAAEDRFLDTQLDVDTIASYRLNRNEAKDKVFMLRTTHAHYLIDREGGEEDKSILGIRNTVIIATHSINAIDSHATMRVDVMCCKSNNDDSKRDYTRENLPQYGSFSLGSTAEFSFTSEKESLREAIKTANELFEERRFFETQKLAKWVFECTSHLLKDKLGTGYQSEDAELWQIFFDAAFRIGFCLMDVELMLKAAYYLEVAFHSNNMEYVQEYVNFHCNTKDPRALEVIENIITRSPKPEDPACHPAWNFHTAFMNRRKAYVLIDMKRYEEAKNLLTSLLDDPECKDFASRELNYIEEVTKSNR